MPGPSRSGCSPQPSAPTTASWRSPPSRRCASTSTWRFFRGSSVATVRTYGAPRSAAGPSGRNTSFGAGMGDADPVGRERRASRSTSRPVYAEFTNTTSQVSAAFRYLRAVHRPRPARSSTRGDAAGRGRGSSSPARRRAAAGTSSRRSEGRRRRRGAARPRDGRALLQAVRTACENGSGQVRSSTSIPARAARIRSGPRMLVGANATISCSPRRSLGETAERALDVVPDPEQRVRQRADVERDPHRAGL